MKRKALISIVVTILGLTFLTGCEPKITTVADDIRNEAGEETEYVTMQQIRIKDTGNAGLEPIGYCALLIPSDFVKSEDVEGMYISKLNPLDSSNIYYSVSDGKDVGVVNSDLTGEGYEKAIEDGFVNAGKQIDIIIDSFSKEEMQGVPCVKIRSHYSAGSRDIQQLVYIIMATETHVITYTQMSDDELMSDFLTDEGEIKLVRERSQA